MATKETKLQIVIDAVNKAGGTFAALNDNLDAVKKGTDSLRGGMETVGKVGTVAFASLVAALGFSAKSYGDAQIAIAKVDATIRAMENTTRTVSTGVTATSSALKLTGVEAQAAANRITALNLKVKEQEGALRKLEDAYKDGDITGSEFRLKTDQLNNSIEANRLAVKKLSADLAETDDKTVVLTKTVKGIGGTFEEVKKRITDASKAVIRLGFDDEAAAVSIAKLFQVTGDLTKAIDLNNLAMDLARAKSISLEDASRMVTLVLAGQGRALKEFGITLDETKSPMEAIVELQQMVAGQAEEAMKSINLQTLVLKETSSNLQDEIGERVTPVLIRLLEAVTPLVERLTDWIDRNPELSQTLIAIALVITGVMAAMLPLAGALPGIILLFTALGTAISFVASTAAPWILAISGIILILVLLAQNGWLTYAAWQDVWLGMKLVAADTANAVTSFVQSMVNAIVSGINTAIRAINSVIAMAQKVPFLGKQFKTLSEFKPVEFDTFQADTIAADDIRSRQAAAALIVNVTGNTFLSEDAAEQMGDLLMKRLKLTAQLPAGI